jgi:hypothetical protein
MATSLSTRVLVVLGLSLAACSSEDAKHTTGRDSGSEQDASAEPATEEDASAPDPGPTAGDTVPLTVWVDDLIDHRTSDEAEPDTVDDKKIEDDTDETSFDKYLP